MLGLSASKLAGAGNQMRQCPNCNSRISFFTFAYPRFSDPIKCPACSAKLKLYGVFAWGTELALLLISYGIYSAIKGNLVELLFMLPISAVLVFLQYHYVGLRILKPG
ncbi:hypothetical protein A9995_06905 [Erythrobacter sp. QSSC1-22B]|nr:hypothetical protein A9995_06905 [Erythrobacter sp. QSSC1-22B]